ncbi:MAG TPA: hypothetical protein VN132_12055 [Bdellovibrio sp.]|nr:hypothetical protein [Bdellovibrio sp.]
MKITALGLLLSLTACVETTTPLCNQANKVDLPGMERTFSLDLFFDPSQPIQSLGVGIKRTGKGEYSVKTSEGNFPVSVCQFGNKKIMESQTKFGTYQQHVLSLQGGLFLNLMIIDAQTLEKGRVPYRIEERTSENILGLNALQSEEKTKALVIDTSKAEDKNFISNNSKAAALGFLFK